MGTVRKIGNDYYIEFKARGLTYQRNGGKDRKAAARLLKEIEGKIQKGETSTAVHDVKISDFFKDFLKLINNDDHPRTVARYESVIGHFQEFIQMAVSPSCRLSQITPSVIEEYRATLLKSTDKLGRVLKPKVINFTFYLLKNILDTAINFGHINDNPVLHTRLIEIKGALLPQTLSDGDVQELMNAPLKNNKNHIKLLLKTGMAPEELSCLKWTNVDLANNCLRIELLPDATHRGRTIPMDAPTAAIFRYLHDQRREHQEYVFGKEGCEAIDINGKSMHYVLRNTFARNVLKKGVSLIGLHKLLGFRDVARVTRYAGLNQ